MSVVGLDHLVQTWGGCRRMKRKTDIRRKTDETETATLSDFVSSKIFKGRNDLLFMLAIQH